MISEALTSSASAVALRRPTPTCRQATTARQAPRLDRPSFVGRQRGSCTAARGCASSAPSPCCVAASEHRGAASSTGGLGCSSPATRSSRRGKHTRGIAMASSTGATAAIADELAMVMKVATDAAQQGARVIREKTGAEVIKTKGNPRDLLTEVDSEVQAIIEGAVTAAFPEHGFLGEESVPPGPAASTAALQQILGDPASPDWLWVVDPIDGTTNFVHSMPLSAISIGVAYKGELVAGLILDPYRDECFTATLGGGAFCNGVPIKVGREATAGDATVASGYGATGSSGPVVRGVEAMVRLPVRTFRMLGSAAIMFAWVACGRLTAYFEADLNAWDIAGGAVLVKEAGGRMSHINGEDYTLSTRCVIGSNGLTHEELCAALQKANVLGLDADE